MRMFSVSTGEVLLQAPPLKKNSHGDKLKGKNRDLTLRLCIKQQARRDILA